MLLIALAVTHLVHIFPIEHMPYSFRLSDPVPVVCDQPSVRSDSVIFCDFPLLDVLFVKDQLEYNIS